MLLILLLLSCGRKAENKNRTSEATVSPISTGIIVPTLTKEITSPIIEQIELTDEYKNDLIDKANSALLSNNFSYLKELKQDNRKEKFVDFFIISLFESFVIKNADITITDEMAKIVVDNHKKFIDIFMDNFADSSDVVKRGISLLQLLSLSINDYRKLLQEFRKELFIRLEQDDEVKIPGVNFTIIVDKYGNLIGDSVVLNAEMKELLYSYSIEEFDQYINSDYYKKFWTKIININNVRHAIGEDKVLLSSFSPGTNEYNNVSNRIEIAEENEKKLLNKLPALKDVIKYAEDVNPNFRDNRYYDSNNKKIQDKEFNNTVFLSFFDVINFYGEDNIDDIINILKMFIDNGANVNAKSRDKQETMLLKACYIPEDKIIKLLLDNGADVNLGNNQFLPKTVYGGDDKYILKRLAETKK